RSRDAIVVLEMFNGGVEMLSLYMRYLTEKSRCYRHTLDVQLMSRDAIAVKRTRIHMLHIIIIKDDTDENDIDGPDNEHDVDWHMMHSMTTNQKSNTNSLKGAYVEAKLPQQ
ncbi:hypothetical protein Tco_1389369, partial [Tanacetum coccineum]